MDFRLPPPELVHHGLRAMKAVAQADGVFDTLERDMLAGAQRFHGTAHDVDALEPIAPEELARVLTDPVLRNQIVQALVIVAAIDGEPTAAELAVIEGFASALDVELAEIESLRKLIDGEMLALRLDVARRFWAREKFVEQWERGGLRWLARALGAALKIKEDRALAERYRDLESYDAGTLGRAYFDHMRSNEFALPGEKGSIPEVIVIHDMTHVLSGYSTDPEGEVQVASFHAGYRRKDPFTFVFFVLLQFHLGVRMTPAGPARTGHFEVEKVLRALQRGAAMNIDLTDGWDPWTVMERPVEELRREYGIPPLR